MRRLMYERMLLFGLITGVVFSFLSLVGLFSFLPWQPFPRQTLFHLLYLASSGILLWMCHDTWNDPVVK